MDIVRIFDGTTSPAFGHALRRAFGEIAKYRRIAVVPEPGSVDLEGYKLVKTAERTAKNRSRGQVDLPILIQEVLNQSGITFGRGVNSLILTEEDLYSDRVNWCFGAVYPDTVGGKHLGMSTYRLQDLDAFTHVATHELGHMFGAAREGRRNTTEELGSHCTNVCIMEQRLTVDDMVEQAVKLAGRQDKFCYDCQEELVSYQP